jgi:competence protein ComEC
LLTAAQPEFAVISVGYKNLYHHPKVDVLERLHAEGAKVFRTDVNGATTFYLGRKTEVGKR